MGGVGGLGQGDIIAVTAEGLVWFITRPDLVYPESHEGPGDRLAQPYEETGFWQKEMSRK